MRDIEKASKVLMESARREHLDLPRAVGRMGSRMQQDRQGPPDDPLHSIFR